MISVLFVCLGNICRSPTAHAVFQTKVNQAGIADLVTVDSAGTGSWHVGDSPDSRARDMAEANGYSMDGFTARQLTQRDTEKFDYILAMDTDNHTNIQSLISDSESKKLYYFLSFNQHTDLLEVPDPYYGGQEGFKQVLTLIEQASDGLLDEICARLSAKGMMN